MARRAIKNVIRVGGTVPLVLGAFALDPSAALAADCDVSGTSLACSDEVLGDAQLTASEDGARAAYDGQVVRTRAAAGTYGVVIECYFCTIDGGPVKGHPACLSGFDPVVDPWVAETVDEILRTASS